MIWVAIIVDLQARAQKRGVLSMWTIYDKPLDLPTGYVARRFEVEKGGPKPTNDMLQTPDLEMLRESFLQAGLTCLARDAEDHPNVVESWL